MNRELELEAGRRHDPSLLLYRDYDLSAPECEAWILKKTTSLLALLATGFRCGVPGACSNGIVEAGLAL